jgi:predicted DNA-binding transcriptional regulator YafY
MSSKLSRIIQMDALIRSGVHPTVHSLQQRFEVSERTVYEDLGYLRDHWGAPLHYDRIQRGYAYTDVTWTLPAAIATEGELLAFFLTTELARRYLGTNFEQPLRAAIERLAAALPAKIQLDLSQLAQHYTFHPGATAGADATLLTVLGECMHDCWPLEITYFTASSGERKQRVIEPYHLFNVRGDWQVVAYDHLRQQVRQFAVTRIEQWQVLRMARFKRDPGFSVHSYLSTGFLAERGDEAVDIEIWFDAYQARYMRGREFHDSQEISEHADGSLTLRFRSGALAEVRRWVMSFGQHARVRAPAALVADVANDLRATLKLYEDCL